MTPGVDGRDRPEVVLVGVKLDAFSGEYGRNEQRKFLTWKRARLSHFLYRIPFFLMLRFVSPLLCWAFGFSSTLHYLFFLSIEHCSHSLFVDVPDTIWRGSSPLPYISISPRTCLPTAPLTHSQSIGKCGPRARHFLAGGPTQVSSEPVSTFPDTFGSLYSLFLFYIFLLICLSSSIFTYLSLPLSPKTQPWQPKNQRAPLPSCRNFSLGSALFPLLSFSIHLPFLIIIIISRRDTEYGGIGLVFSLPFSLSCLLFTLALLCLRLGIYSMIASRSLSWVSRMYSTVQYFLSATFALT